MAAKTISLIAVTGMLFVLIFTLTIPFNCALGYKKLLKGILLGAFLTKHNKGEDHHHFYPMYHSMPVYDDYGHY